MKQLIGLVLLLSLILTVTIAVVSCTTTGAVENQHNSSPVATMKPDKSQAPIPSLPLNTNEESSKETSKEESSVPVINTPDVTTYYSITEEERDMLATLCYLESSICSEECQKAVVSVIFNRLDSNKWRKDVNKDGKITLYDIVYYPNAFSPAHLIESYKDKTTQECYDAVDYVVANGPTVPTYVRYFRTNYHFKWDGYKGYCDMDNVYFGYMVDWQKGAW